MIQIEVAYAAPDKQKILTVEVKPGTNVFDGAKNSGIDKVFPEIDFDKADMGIFGKAVRKPLEQELKEGDRIEIYRPLMIDPKQARLNRAAKKD
ncbi:RnfH family protein [Oleiphilus sp. HI0081]|nr:RnfH family protein [Oleiphilus sp. HI0043]KZY58492.1 RnfH family protein [Oleiphilus sp. HI0061]KZY76027.1 RnfH family protein [Oleiphilus sp. HI0068]KZY78378.1 RnfH family protein [Oleiphilus sp. HI0069]KZY88878.1 RnfH family protein [Oleiphilus sp. HI0072]KZZ13690.1 RnfH family protein [Oleiphilus sp. HI0078]KZZ29310.1 RnfH family protein [Oleiphilus sp. HI0081]KZZ35044.1 RnfH family protein [Oleiphilus sp. HI0086]KZZ35196.1 RnfH family protein [Oleiphilus sp. HI0117]KZZ47416.1 RnfH 